MRKITERGPIIWAQWVIESRRTTFIRSRPNWNAGLWLKSGSTSNSESHGPEIRVSRWRRPNSDNYSQDDNFGLVYDMIYWFLGMEAKNYKFSVFCQQCHPCIRGPRWCQYSTEKCLQGLHLLFVYVVILSISPLWRTGEANPFGKTSKILFWIVMTTFGKSCHRPWLHGLRN